MESNWTRFELIFIKFFDLFFNFWINRIANFRVESIKVPTNPIFGLFESIKSNQTNFERIPISENLVPPYSWSRIESNEFRINFHQIFRIVFAFAIQSNGKFSIRIKQISNQFQFDSTPKLIQWSECRI